MASRAGLRCYSERLRVAVIVCYEEFALAIVAVDDLGYAEMLHALSLLKVPGRPTRNAICRV